jgi:transcriptional regulator GlxA family with amidase domain
MATPGRCEMEMSEIGEVDRPGRGRHGRAIGIVVSDGFSLVSVGVVAEALQLANELGDSETARRADYHVRLLSLCGGAITCSSSVQVWTESFDVLPGDGFDALFVAGGPHRPGVVREDHLIDWLRTVPTIANVMKPIAGADASLNGIRLEDFDVDSRGAASRPVTIFDIGSTASDDRYEAMRTALTLVKRDLGLDAAREIAERLMPERSADVLPGSKGAGMSLAERIRETAQWLRDSCDQPISVADAAQRTAMSQRNFLRRFKREMGSTPSEYLLTARLEMTCRLLRGTELPVDKIARRAGMGNGDNLTKFFRKRWSMSPTEYRRRHQRGLEVVVQFGRARSGESSSVAAG